MNDEWWESPVCWLCDYGWILLLLLILGLAAFFTRRYWLPGEAEPTLGTGDVQVTLRWQGINDLDLHVFDPTGAEIFYQQPSAPSGGLLDVDSNAGCTDAITERPIENVFWPADGAPIGDYRIAVQYFAQCTDPAATEFEVRLLVNGSEQFFEGVAARDDEWIDVTSFSR